MKPYANLSGDSGVESFDFTDTAIKVKFRKNAKIYVYDQSHNGHHIAIMKQLANSGHGLSAYIAKNKKTLQHTIDF